MIRSIFVFFIAIVILASSSCSHRKKITYFENVPDTIRGSIAVDASRYLAPVIKSNDLLSVSIQTLDPQANLTIGSVIGSANYRGTAGQMQSPLYMVDSSGFIELPLVGRIYVRDKTTNQCREEIRQSVARYYKDPVVTVKFANFTVTVLGEVSRPGQYIIENEKASILDVIGLAGDLTIYGKRENILLLRGDGDKKQMTRIDLTSTSLFTSEFFYLQQGDVVYVEPSKAKVATTDLAQVRNFTIMTSIVNLLIIVVTRVNFR